MRSRPIRAASTAAALVLLAVAGCSAASPDPGPTSAPATATTVATPTPAATTPLPTPTPTWPIAMAMPPPPPEMSRDDEAGAIAAATYFITELYPYTYVSQNTVPLEAVSHEKCQFCATVLSAVASERMARRATHPGVMTVLQASTEAMSPLEYQVTMDIDQAANTLWSSDGVLIGSNNPHQTRLAVFVLWRADRWILRGVDALVIDGITQ